MFAQSKMNNIQIYDKEIGQKKKKLKILAISILVIVSVLVLGVLCIIYAEYNAIFYDKFKIEFDSQTNEEKIDIQIYFVDELL